MGHQLGGVRPRHVGVLGALQDVHRAAGLDQPVAEEVGVAVLDQPARDRIGLVGIVAGLQEDAGGFQLLPRRCVHVSHISLRVMSTAGAISTSPASRPEPANRSASSSAIQPPMDEPTTICGPSVEPAEHRLRLLQPARDGAVREAPARAAVAGIVEAGAGEPAPGGISVDGARLAALHVGAEAAQPEQPRAARRRGGARRSRGSRRRLVTVADRHHFKGRIHPLFSLRAACPLTSPAACPIPVSFGTARESPPARRIFLLNQQRRLLSFADLSKLPRRPRTVPGPTRRFAFPRSS